MAARDITVVVPVLNEAPNIAPVLTSLHQALDGLDWEVLFVNDDSRDGTAEALDALSRTDPHVRHVLRVASPGLANSCIQGMLSSSADVLCVMDGDGQHDANLIRALRRLVGDGGADLASAARVLPNTDRAALSAARQKLSRAGNALLRMTLRRDTADPLSGFFVIRRDAFLGVVRHLSESGFKLLFDILVSAPRLRHVEVPHALRPRLHGNSKLDTSVAWQLFTLVIEKLTRGIIPTRLASFLAVGGLGFGVHIGALYSVLALGAAFSTAQAAAALVAATFNFALNNLLTWRERRFRGADLILGWLAYMAVGSVGLIANVAVATWAYAELRGMAFFAACAGIAMDALWKFVVSDRLIWRKQRR